MKKLGRPYPKYTLWSPGSEIIGDFFFFFFPFCPPMSLKLFYDKQVSLMQPKRKLKKSRLNSVGK